MYVCPSISYLQAIFADQGSPSGRIGTSRHPELQVRKSLKAWEKELAELPDEQKKTAQTKAVPQLAIRQLAPGE